MQIAIVGLAGSGKTTVFNTLTRGHAETGGYGGVALNVGVVKAPDERLDRLAEIFKPKKIVHADVTYVDLPAPPPSSDGRVGTEELPAEHLARLRESDALLHVVRAFESPAVPHPEGSVDPARDLERLDFEFVIADLVLVLLNVGESEIATAPDLVERIGAGYDHRSSIVDALSARIEMELGELEPD